MKRILAALLVFGLIGGLALADEVDVDSQTASVAQDITVIIPQRAALHITETEWTLDLDSDASINEYCRFISKNAMAVLPAFWFEKSYLETLPLATDYGYPPINPAATTITDDDKGYLVCVFEKVVQKFANMEDGWTIEVGLYNSGTEWFQFGVFGISDAFGDELLWETTDEWDTVLLSYYQGGTTGGWLDDFITEAFLFDGTEWAATHNFELTFDLLLP